jgi:hypothetical protein
MDGLEKYLTARRAHWHRCLAGPPTCPPALAVFYDGRIAQIDDTLTWIRDQTRSRLAAAGDDRADQQE